MPNHPDELPGTHRMVGFPFHRDGGFLPLEFSVDGRVRSIALPTTFSVNAAESYFAAAKLGFGLIQIPRYHADYAAKSGELVEVLAQFPPTGSPVSVLYPRDRQLSPRVRVFIDWLVQVFSRTA